jgi:hypothetical protein
MIPVTWTLVCSVALVEAALTTTSVATSDVVWFWAAFVTTSLVLAETRYAMLVRVAVPPKRIPVVCEVVPADRLNRRRPSKK